MPAITVSSKYQVTLPMEIVRAMDLKPGDKLLAEAIDWRIVLMKGGENAVERFKGSLKGVYGSTVEEIDRYIAGERGGQERWEWREQFEDLMRGDEDVAKMVNYLLRCPKFTSGHSDLCNRSGVARQRFAEVLEKLVQHGGVRKIIPAPPVEIGDLVWYRLVREIARHLQGEAV
ncbi:MAG: AbrB/MazE/SpoVT family DNA-binding domain-containing protein [Chloroflexi bacterium]|nr:AbrB/MazE/SpoVT family DNA-binding domain-containing protein [Chloroflexota bacterium]